MGAGYTRQSAAEIQTGEVVEASPLNAEFNQLQNAFDGSTGHTHDGTVGEGPKINLSNSVVGVLQVVNGGSGGINKINATTAPTATDDANDGYVEGSIWVDVTGDIIYLCVDSTPTAAIWQRYQLYDAALQSISGLTTAGDRMIYTTSPDTYAVTPLTSYMRTLLDDTNAATARTTLGLVIGTDVQAQDAELQALAGLVSAADRVPYFTGSGTASLATFTAAGRALVDDADAAAQRATLGLVIGTDVQAQDAELSAIAGLVSAADRLPYFTGSGTAALATFTTAGRALVDDADATAQRTTLGLGTIATQNSNSVTITGGSISSTTITATTQSPGNNSTSVATTAYVDQAIPPAAVMPFYRATAPTGWLAADGTNVSRTTYSALWAAMGSPNTGDGSTTFTLPDLRAEFVRGLDNGRGVDTGRVLGTAQAADYLAHTHTGTTASAGAHVHGIKGSSGTGGSVAVINSAAGGFSPDDVTSSAGAHTHTFTTASSGGTETRPRNVALLYCIKF
jgi:microcystin-dependent protein